VDDVLYDQGGEDGEGEDGELKCEYVVSQYVAYGTGLRLYEFSLTCCMRGCSAANLPTAGRRKRDRQGKKRVFSITCQAIAE
jgi:hypothetical protein